MSCLSVPRGISATHAFPVAYVFYKCTPLSLCSDAHAAFDFAQAVSLSNGDPPGAPSPHLIFRGLLVSLCVLPH
jgi:hypothetical protein